VHYNITKLYIFLSLPVNLSQPSTRQLKTLFTHHVHIQGAPN